MKDERKMKDEIEVTTGAEPLESCNKRDNIKVIGLPEVIKDDGKPEAYAETIREIVKLANKIDVNVAEQDVSIAHRLPFAQKGKRALVFGFNRRFSKIEMLKKKFGESSDTTMLKCLKILVVPV